MTQGYNSTKLHPALGAGRCIGRNFGAAVLAEEVLAVGLVCAILLRFNVFERCRPSDARVFVFRTGREPRPHRHDEREGGEYPALDGAALERLIEEYAGDNQADQGREDLRRCR